eukprot:943070-Pelagomonas_calceolata.AAC.3
MGGTEQWRVTRIGSKGSRIQAMGGDTWWKTRSRYAQAFKNTQQAKQAGSHRLLAHQAKLAGCDQHAAQQAKQAGSFDMHPAEPDETKVACGQAGALVQASFSTFPFAAVSVQN